jgi:hypothetical protein
LNGFPADKSRDFMREISAAVPFGRMKSPARGKILKFPAGRFN